MVTVHGACHCGSISYVAEIDPSRVTLCHCTDCQVLSGCAYRVSVPALRGQVEILQGSPVVYVNTADSGARRAQALCGKCGSPLFTWDLASPDRWGLRMGAIAERARLPPTGQVWCKSALAWAQDIRDLPGNATERTS